MITLKDVSGDFGNFHIKNINLNIKKKEYYVILGPTAAGKTILLEIIAGFHKLRKGKLYINGKNMKDIRPYERKIGFLYQDYSLFPHLSVEKNISFGLEIQKVDKDEIKRKTLSMMENFNLTNLKDRSPLTLSGGEQQKVALARALIINPKILLLDEPYSALDPVSRKDAMKVVKQIHKSHDLTIVCVTHNQNEAMIGDRISLIMEGQIVDTGTPKQIFNSPKNEKIASFVGIENIFKGEIVNYKDGYVEVKTEKFSVHCLSKFDTGTVILFLRPENIILSKTLFKSSLRNKIKSIVKEIFVISKELIQILLDNDIIAYITFNAKEDLDLKVGDEIYASFKATSVSIKR
ncbi:MAG: ATP-binding cassette domain-containing protein [Promethearchaeota archaeon]